MHDLICGLLKMQVGVSVEDGANPIIRGNKIHDGNSCGISLMTDSRGIVEDNDIWGNMHPNVYIASGADPQVGLCLLFHLQKQHYYDGVVSLLKCIPSWQSLFPGMHTNEHGAFFQVRHNEMHHSHSCGITVVEKGLGIIEQNDVYCNQSIGLYIVTGAAPTVRNNSVRDGEGDGIAGVCAEMFV
jgi:parallel beta-helix repeat protein